MAQGVGKPCGKAVDQIDRGGFAELVGANYSIVGGDLPWLLSPLVCALGVVLLLVTLHGSRWVGGLHGSLAKHLLVRN